MKILNILFISFFGRFALIELSKTIQKTEKTGNEEYHNDFYNKQQY